MTKIAYAFTLSAILVCSLQAAPAHAAALRTFVSGFGNDSNTSTNCSHAQPCRTFAVAVTVTAPGGEIEALDPAGYGPITISGPLTLVGLPGAAVNVPSGGNGITISAGATDAVHVQGLLIDGSGVGTTGILFNSGKSLTVENCILRNVVGGGLFFRSTATTPQTLAVSNSYFDENGEGIQILTLSSGTILASIDRTGLYGNGDSGLFVTGSSGTGALTVAVTDTVAANNSTGFFVASSTGKSISNLSLTHVMAEGNSHVGVEAFGAMATLWLAQSTLTGNGASYIASSPAVLNTYGDNYIDTSNGPPIGSLTGANRQ